MAGPIFDFTTQLDYPQFWSNLSLSEWLCFIFRTFVSIHVVLLKIMCPGTEKKHHHVPWSECAGIAGWSQGNSITWLLFLTVWAASASLMIIHTQRWLSFLLPAGILLLLPRLRGKKSAPAKAKTEHPRGGCLAITNIDPMGEANLLSPIWPWFSTESLSLFLSPPILSTTHPPEIL